MKNQGRNHENLIKTNVFFAFFAFLGGSGRGGWRQAGWLAGVPRFGIDKGALVGTLLGTLLGILLGFSPRSPFMNSFRLPSMNHLRNLSRNPFRNLLRNPFTKPCRIPFGNTNSNTSGNPSTLNAFAPSKIF